jgi:hypothetical protein
MLQLQLEKSEAQVVSYITERDSVQRGECAAWTGLRVQGGRG